MLDTYHIYKDGRRFYHSSWQSDAGTNLHILYGNMFRLLIGKDVNYLRNFKVLTF